ncbi:hypothetical protein ACIPO9_16100 [Pseudomonas sp. NPDC090203]|uniref:hypothetical protein n=1 Tax=Pseudomonas sp. NPDC090203 TaxID=3364477 RepID=UPI0037F4A8BD
MFGPYAFINDRSQNLSGYRDSVLLRGHARTKFDQLNAHLGLGLNVLPGELILLGDESTSMCTPHEQQLMSYARDVRQTLMPSNAASSHAAVQNYDLLQNIMSYGSIGVGSVTSGWATHLNAVQDTLKEINGTYQKWRSGVFTKDQFVAHRQKLFTVLDGQLRGIGRWGTGLRNNSTIKKMLGISSKRYWANGEIRDYAKNLKRINNVARNLSAGTLVGVTLDLGAGAMEISEACSSGREQECTRAKFVEVGKMMLGIPASMAGGRIGERAFAQLCLRLAGPSRGASIAVCGIAGAAVGGWGSGSAGSSSGGMMGTMLYELLGDE